MPDVLPQSSSPLDVLSELERKRFQNACRAFESGEWDYVLSACVVLLAAHAECLPVRRLQRAALFKKFPKRSGWLGKLSGVVSRFLFSLGRTREKKSATEQLAHAESRLAKNPYDTLALRLLGEAATALGWAETAIFAHEAIREIEPKNRANLLALGEALLTAERATAALSVADSLLAENPVDGEAQTLMRKASIAQTLDEGNWEETGDFRTKVKAESRGAV